MGNGGDCRRIAEIAPSAFAAQDERLLLKKRRRPRPFFR